MEGYVELAAPPLTPLLNESPPVAEFPPTPPLLKNPPPAPAPQVDPPPGPPWPDCPPFAVPSEEWFPEVVIFASTPCWLILPPAPPPPPATSRADPFFTTKLPPPPPPPPPSLLVCDLPDCPTIIFSTSPWESSKWPFIWAPKPKFRIVPPLPPITPFPPLAPKASIE